MILLLKNLVFTVLVPGTVAVFVPIYFFGGEIPGLSAVSVAAGLLLLLGATIYFWCLWDFATAGRGTPAPVDPPKALVVRGLYRLTRNPMYVGVLCVIAGWALLYRSLHLAVYGMCVALCFHLFVRLYEEPHLKEIFGPAYEQYCARVSRWLPLP